MAYEAGTAFLQIVPSFQGVVEKISEQAASWGKTAGDAFKETFQESTKGISLGPSDSDSSRQGSSSGGAFADGFRAKVTAALKALPAADVQLNDAEASAKLDDIRARLETLRNVDIGVDLTDAQALSAVEILKGELDELAAKSPSIRVQVDGAEASAELGAIGAEADAAGGGMSSLGGDAEGAAGAVGPLIGALALLATALIPIGGLAAGALSTLPALFAGAASGLGALKLGFSGISGALSAYTQQQNKAGGAAASSGQSATSAAEQALSAAQEEQSAAQAVASAQESLANAQQQATDSVHSANEQLTSSEQALAEAEQNETNAQTALTQARIDAANAITNLNDQVADGALAIQQAQLDAASANQALTAAQQTPGTSSSTLAQAQLSAQEAQQHVQDLTDQQAQLTQAQQQSAAAGVDGNQQVIAATQSLGQAQQTVTNDQQANVDAQNALTEAQASAVQKVTDANTTLSQAIQNQADTLQRVALEAQAAGASAGGAASGTNAFATAMAGLSPAGRDFVNFVTSTLLPLYDNFKAKVQQALLPGITKALVELLPVFKEIEPFIIDAATGISQFAQNLGGILSSGPGLFNISAIFQEGAGFMKDLAKAALELVPAFLTIGQQASPVVKALGDGIDHIVGAFAKWVANGGFETFLRWLQANGPRIAGELGEIFKAVGKLVIDLLPFGEGVLSVVAGFAKLISDASPFIGFLSTVVGWLIQFVQPFTAIDAAIDELRSHWKSVWTDIQNDASAAWSWIQGNIIGPLVTFFTSTIPNALDTAVGFFEGLPGNIGRALGGLFGAITGAFGDVGSWVNTNLIQPVVGFFTDLPKNLGTALGDIGSAIEDAFKTAFNFVAKIWNDTVGKVNFTIPGWVPVVGGDSFGFPQMPTFHDGGVVPGPSGSDVPAILQAGELVIPRSNVGNLGAVAAGNSQPSKSLTINQAIQAFDPVSAAITMQQKSDFAAKTRGF